MRARKIPVLFFIFVFLFTFSFVSLPAQASSGDITLEKAIRIVRQSFTIPAQYTDFSSSYLSENNRSVLSLTWCSPDETGGSFNAQVDTTNGEIISMSQWTPTLGPQKPKLPTMTVEEARNQGYLLLKSLIPSRVESLKPLASDQVISLNNYGPITCTLRWQRQVNGIPVPADGAVMDIDLASGRVLSYSLNWSSLPFPAAQGIISDQEALKAFKEAGMLELQYVIPHSFTPLKNGQDSSPRLAYRMVSPSGGAIDAFSGRPLVPAPGHYLTGGVEGEYGGGGEQKADASALTPEEQNEIEYSSRLLPKEKAEDVVKDLIFPLLGEDAGSLTLRSANLEKDWRNPKARLWTLNYSSYTDENKGALDLYVRLNAESGQLMSFYLAGSGLKQPSSNMSREEAEKVALEFLNKAAPTYLAQVKATPVSASGLRPNEETSFDFAYQRMVNNIPCPENGINISVDRGRGIVTSFNLTWNEVSFPSPEGVIGIDKAVQVYLEKSPLTLTYLTEWDKQGEQAVRLVYRPQDAAGQPGSFLVDAVTGAVVDGDGNPLKEELKPLHFKDIKGVKGSQEIAILGQAGIMGEYGDFFRPAEKIHLSSLLRAMIACRSGAYSVQGLPDEEIIKQAKNMGIITGAPAGNPVVTREMFCRLMVRYLGIDYLAARPSLFTITYSDVPSDLRGYVAVVRGLNLLTPAGKQFGLKEPVTRLEAAVALIRALTAASQ